MMTRRVLPILLAATAGLLLGSLWRTFRSQAPTHHQAMAGPMSLLSSRTARFANVKVLARDDLSESQRLNILADFEVPHATAECWELLRRLNSWSTDDYMVLGVLVPQVIDHLVETDPEVAFERLWQSSGWKFREAYLGTFFQSWTRADPQGALAQLDRLDNTGSLKRRLAGAVADVLIRSDPETSVRLIGDYQLEHQDKDFLSHATFSHRFREAFSALAAQKPLLAATEAQRLTDRHQRKLALVATLETWGGKAPEQALAFLLNRVVLQESHHLSDLWAALSRGMSGHDLKNALELISTHVPPDRQHRPLEELAGTWARSDPQEAADFALAHPVLGPSMAQAIGKAWAEQDSEAARNWADSLSGEWRRFAMKGLAAALRIEDPARAFEAFAESGDPDAGVGLVKLSASRDWRGTIDTLSQWQDPRLRGHAAMTLFRYAYETSRPLGADGALLVDWIAAAADDLRHFHGMADAIGEENLAYLKKEYPMLYQKALPSLTSTHARVDPALAAALAGDFQDDNQRHEQLVRIIHQWAARAPEEAAQWLHTQPHGTAREAGIAALIDTWNRFDPAAARLWEGDRQAPAEP